MIGSSPITYLASSYLSVIWKPGEFPSIGHLEKLLPFLWDGSLQTAIISQLCVLDPTKILLRGAKELEEFIMGGMLKEGPENRIIAKFSSFMMPDQKIISRSLAAPFSSSLIASIDTLGCIQPLGGKSMSLRRWANPSDSPSRWTCWWSFVLAR